MTAKQNERPVDFSERLVCFPYGTCSVAPVAPVIPVGPVAPVAPVIPVGPVVPVGPVAPVGAVTYGICLFVCPRKSAGAFEINL